MDNPLQFMVPVAGFVAGLIFWSRIIHLVVAAAGLTPRPANVTEDTAALLVAFRRVVLLVAAVWVTGIGAALAYALHSSSSWALLFAGIFAVPFFTVANFFRTVRSFKNRAAGLPPRPQPIRKWFRKVLSTRRGVMLFCLVGFSIPMWVVFLRLDYLEGDLDWSQFLWVSFVCLVGGAISGAFMWYAIVLPLSTKFPTPRKKG